MKRFSTLRTTLFSIVLIDELIAGFPVVGIPLLRAKLGLSYEQVGLLFTVAGLVAMVLEPMINLLSDQGSKKRWILSGLAIFVVAPLIAGYAGNYAILLLAFVLAAPAGALVVGLAQAALIDLDPQQSLRTMTRWTLLGGIGDFLSPLTVAIVVSLGFGWTALCWIEALCWLTIILVLLPQRLSKPKLTLEEAATATPAPKLLESLRQAVRDPELLHWAVLALIPTMVDEIFLTNVTLYMSDVLHASEALIGFMLTISLVGTIIG